MPNGKEAPNLDAPLSSLKPFLVTEGIRYREVNERVKPDAIPIAILPMDSEILPKTQAERVCNTLSDTPPMAS